MLQIGTWINEDLCIPVVSDPCPSVPSGTIAFAVMRASAVGDLPCEIAHLIVTGPEVGLEVDRAVEAGDGPGELAGAADGAGRRRGG